MAEPMGLTRQMLTGVRLRANRIILSINYREDK